MVWPRSVMSPDAAFLLLLEFPVASYVPDGNMARKNAKKGLPDIEGVWIVDLYVEHK